MILSPVSSVGRLMLHRNPPPLDAPIACDRIPQSAGTGRELPVANEEYAVAKDKGGESGADEYLC